jgi:hypothetical protein
MRMKHPLVMSSHSMLQTGAEELAFCRTIRRENRSVVFEKNGDQFFCRQISRANHVVQVRLQAHD